MNDDKKDQIEDNETEKLQRTIDAVLTIYDSLKEKDLLDVVAPACANIMAAMHDHHLGGEEESDQLMLAYLATVKGDQFYTVTIDPDIDDFLHLCIQSGMTDIGIGDAVTFKRESDEGEGSVVPSETSDNNIVH